jgi:glycosyltransferase involved in cell wall biosynthesis
MMQLDGHSMNGSINPGEVAERAEAIYQSGKCDEAIDLLVAATSQLPEDRQLPLKLAQLLMDSDQFANALSVLEKIPVENNGYDVVALQGLCQAGMDDFENASQSAWQLQKSDRHRASASLLQGVIAFRQGDNVSAEKFLRETVGLDPTCAEAYHYLGLVENRNGHLAGALASLQTGFDLAPTVRDIALAYHDEVVAQSRLDVALPAFAKAIDRYPANQRLRFLHIDILLRCRSLQKAMDAILDCLAIFRPDPGLLDAALRIRGQLDESDTDAAVESGQTLSLCMITRNEECQLARCLASTRKIVDEIIIVDTGSEDRTIDVAKSFGARVYEMRWKNDFAEARNCSLAQASGEWILILDADEIIAPQDTERLRSIVEDKSAGRVAYAITTRNYTRQANLVGWIANDQEYDAESAGNGWYPSRKVRLFKNEPGIRFSYPIHELVEPSLKASGIRIIGCPVPVHHYGKLNGEKNDQKARAYYRLGKKKLAELGDNAVALREMAVQAAGLEKFAEAADLWQHYLKLDPGCAEAYVNLGTACWNMGDYRAAAGFAEEALKLAPDFKEARFNLALAHLYSGSCEKAIAVLEELLDKQPQYLSARFALAAAYACGDLQGRAATAFKGVRASLSEMEYNIALTETSQRLQSAGLSAFAQRVIRFKK